MPISRKKDLEGWPDFDRLFEPHRKILVREARRDYYLCNDSAEDLVQETLIRAYRAKDKFDLFRKEEARAWLSKIMFNCFLNTIRSQKRKPTVPLSEEGYEASKRNDRGAFLYGQCGQPDEQFEAEYISPELQKAIDDLPETHRMVFWLGVIEELSYSEVAEVVGIKIGTVRSRLFNAKVYLRKALAIWITSATD